MDIQYSCFWMQVKQFSTFVSDFLFMFREHNPKVMETLGLQTMLALTFDLYVK